MLLAIVGNRLRPLRQPAPAGECVTLPPVQAAADPRAFRRREPAFGQQGSIKALLAYRAR